MSELDRRKAARWAKELLSARDFVVLDSETTGLGNPIGFVEIAIADPDGEPLLNSTVNPGLRIEPGATRVHGYRAKDLEDAPAFRDLYPEILDAVSGRRVVVFNAAYDRRVFDASVGRLGARGKLLGAYLPAWECCMRRYADYVGEHSSKHGGYKYQKLPGGDHSALGDCRATLAVLQKISAT